MAKIEINKEKCIQCGACVRDCITYSIEMGEDKYPRIADSGESRCISCQHCFAVCPAMQLM
jgi:ferredoxin